MLAPRHRPRAHSHGPGSLATTDPLGRILARAVTAQAALEYAAEAPAAICTYDVATEKWAVADARGAPVRAEDNRRFGQADASRDRQRAVFLAVGAVEGVEQIDDLELAQIQDINPQSIVPYRILHDVLHESWHVAKELLLNPKAPNPVNRRAMMSKLWEYRQWHHQAILAEVQDELVAREKDEKALMASSSAGSTTLSSDIDVNLKGTRTELAVALFNARFRDSRRWPAHRWTNEPGVVYDVNVYAVDFMHRFGTVADDSGHDVTLKEGKRTGHERGGIADATLAEADRRNQLVTALFKARLFMDAERWASYKAVTLRGLPDPALEAQRDAFDAAEVRFAGYLDEMFEQIDVTLGARVDQRLSGVDQLKSAAALRAPGHGPHDHAAVAAQENVLMTAANRIYERKLAKIYSERAVLKSRIDAYEAAAGEIRDVMGRQIDRILLNLRGLVAEAAMYANEASMTDATIHHVVVGLQGGKQIHQQKSEAINAVHENLADVMKEAGRYGPGLGIGAFKAGKYLMRMADAGKNLGFGYIWGVQVLYDLGHRISEDIKKRSDSGTIDPAAESAGAVRELTGATTLDELLALAIKTDAEITHEYSQERLAHTRAHGSDTQTAYGHRTAAKKTRNANLLNLDMVHPVDRAPGITTSELQEAEKAGVLSAYAFRMSATDLAAMKEKWAAKSA